MKKKKLNFYLKANEQQPFHLVDISPWPFMLSTCIFSFVLSFLLYFNYYKNGLLFFFLNFFLVCFYLSQWFMDIVTESTYEGHHTEKVQQGIRFGMCLFILSEIMFFFSFFWAFFHSALIMSIYIGDIWPPVAVVPLDPWAFPSLNTAILLSSGITITWSHRAILSGQRHATINGLVITIFYGVLFTFIQYYEYTLAPFCINDSIFGSLFFMLTGFHGIHVLIGSIFLVVCLFRLWNYHFTSNHHVGYECCIWYWHFVDCAGTKYAVDCSRFKSLKGYKRYFGYFCKSFLRVVSSSDYTVTLWAQKALESGFSKGRVSLKRPTKDYETGNLLLVGSYRADHRPIGFPDRFKFRVYNSTGNISKNTYMCTNGNLTLRTMGEVGKGLYTTYGDKKNPLALFWFKRSFTLHRNFTIDTNSQDVENEVSDVVTEDESQLFPMDHTKGPVIQIEEVVDEFFNNDEKFFERAVSIEALQRAWFELKSKPGMSTPATDEITLSGISKKWFVTANQKLLAGTFKFPNRRRMSIAKSGGGKRPLTISNPRIKIIEKALLNAVEPHFEGLYRWEEIDETEFDKENTNHRSCTRKKVQLYEKKHTIIPTIFSPHSYGFRPGRSAHQALKQIRHWRTTTTYIIDYDISKAFDDVNQSRLKNLFNKIIKDTRFWRTINQILNSGVIEGFIQIFEEKGLGQGSVISPFLFNVYMDALDKKIKQLQNQTKVTHKTYLSGAYGDQTAEKEYRAISREFASDRLRKTLQKYGSREAVIKARREAYKKHHDKYGRRKGVDPNTRYIQYVRYADDFLIGVVGSNEFAVKVRQEVTKHIKGDLHLNVKKDNLLHRNDADSTFLGHNVGLREYRLKTSSGPKAIRAFQKNKNKVIARFKVADKRLARSKVNEFRANIMREISRYCKELKVSVSKKSENISNIASLIAYKELGKQLMVRLRVKDWNELIPLLKEVTDEDSLVNIGKENPALQRWIKALSEDAALSSTLARDIIYDMLEKETKESWVDLKSKGTATKLLALRDQYIEKTSELVSETEEELVTKYSKKIIKGMKVPDSASAQSEEDKELILLSKDLALEQLNKEVPRRIVVNATIKETAEKLRMAGYMHPLKHKASGNAKLQFYTDAEIVKLYNSVIAGILRWYSGAGNFSKVKGLAMLMRKSCVLTLCGKHKKSQKWVYDIYGSEIVIQGGGKAIPLIKRYTIANWKNEFNLRSNSKTYEHDNISDIIKRARSLSHGLEYFQGCTVKGCDVYEDIEVHHIRRLPERWRKMERPVF